MFYKIKTKLIIRRANSFNEADRSKIANMVNIYVESIGESAKTKNVEEYDIFIENKLSFYQKEVRAVMENTSFFVWNSLLALICISHLKGDKKNAELIIQWVYDNKTN